MGFKFRKKVKILPGISLNLSKSGVSATVKAGSVSFNSRTKKLSMNLPGNLSYTFDQAQGMTKKELTALARDSSLSGYSALNKKDLIEFLKEHNVIT